MLLFRFLVGRAGGGGAQCTDIAAAFLPRGLFPVSTFLPPSLAAAVGSAALS